MKCNAFLTIVIFLNATNNSIHFRIIKLNITEFEDGESNFQCERLEVSEKLEAQVIAKSSCRLN